MAAFQLQNLMVAYKERFDKDNFIKNLLLDNLLLVDIYSRSKKLHIQTDVKRAVLIVESQNGKDANILEKVRENFGQNGRDFVTAVDENNVIVVKEIADYRDKPRYRQVCAGDRGQSGQGRHQGGAYFLWHECEGDQGGQPLL